MTTTRNQKDNAEQSKTFIDKAREIEADNDDASAELLMGRLAKMKPKPRQKKTPATSKKAPESSRTGDRSNR